MDRANGRSHATRQRLLEAGLEVFARDGFRPARDDEDGLDNIGFAFFDDPDGNGWAVQQIRRG